MTDLEICTFIAKLENINFRVNGDKLDNMDNLGFEGQPYYYDPLTDDALCFKLMVKYEVNVNFVECPADSGKAYYATGSNKDKKTICTDYVETPNRAICLAIIEANKND